MASIKTITLCKFTSSNPIEKNQPLEQSTLSPERVNTVAPTSGFDGQSGCAGAEEYTWVCGAT